ncbi:hypothetical protein PSENEW3_00005739 [Picochlorum sp. SENEW3]|nr:hypothetical protein PSENEW3_00005739 [Picochlorum sp. SENEW3]
MTSPEQIQDMDGHIVVSLGDSRALENHDDDQPRGHDPSPSSSSEIEPQTTTSEHDEVTSIHGEEEPLVQSVAEEEEEEDHSRQVSYFGGMWNAFRSKFSSLSRNDPGTNDNTSADPEEGGTRDQGRIGPMDIEQGGQEELSPTTSGSREAPVCLICLEPLMPEDFSSGKAMSLDCGCRGDLALRHRDCAVKWSQVKDDGRGGLPTCELCKMPVRNLPELPARPQAAQENGDDGEVTIEEVYLNDPSQFQQFAPSRADIIFDCVRVTWIAMIVSILFFDASIGAALWTGLVAGAAYILMLRLLYKQHFEAMRAYAEQQARQHVDPVPSTHIPVVHVV